MANLTFFKNHYNTELVYENVVHYAAYPSIYNKFNQKIGNTTARYCGGYNIYVGDMTTLGTDYVAYQMKQTIAGFGKDFGQNLLHFALNFDSNNQERHISAEDAVVIANLVCEVCLPEYQTFWAVHENRSTHLHIHFVVNGVNLATKRKLPRKKGFYKQIAEGIHAATNLPTPNIIHSAHPYMTENM
jgi:Cu2+-containing amine oxidase